MKNRLENIQHLRGIAALLVVFVHFPTELQQFSGSIGVDIFFLISGFIIYTSIEKSGYSEKPFIFLKKRLLRIVPLYFAVISLFILMHWGLNMVRYSPIAPQLKVQEIIQSYLFFPISKDGVYKDPVVFLGWSLNFEMFFYLVTFIFLLFFRKRYFIPLLITLFSLPLIGLIKGGFETVPLDFITSSFLFYFCAGLLIGRYQDWLCNFLSRFAEVLFLASVYLLFLAMLGKDYDYGFTGISREMVVYNDRIYYRFFLWGIPSLLFFLSYFSLSRKYDIRSKLLNELGNRSYSIYLLQVFFIQIIYEIGFKFDNVELVILSVLLMDLLVMFSGISYKYFEKRFHS